MGLESSETGLLESVTSAVVDRARTCTVPILRKGDDNLYLWATGTLFRIADKSFIITAGHVVEDILSHSLAVPLSPSTREVSFISGRCTSYGDPLDLAVLCLNEGLAAELDGSRRFVGLSEIEGSSLSAPGGWYCIAGYPRAWSESNIEQRRTVAKPLAYATCPYTGPTSRLSQYDPQKHILLSYEGRGRKVGQVETARLPDGLEGMSGCTVWRGLAEAESSADWTPERIKAAAIQVGAYENGRIIKATKWYHVIRLIAEFHPDLLPSIKLVRPN